MLHEKPIQISHQDNGTNTAEAQNSSQRHAEESIEIKHIVVSLASGWTKTQKLKMYEALDKTSYVIQGRKYTEQSNSVLGYKGRLNELENTYILLNGRRLKSWNSLGYLST